MAFTTMSHTSSALPPTPAEAPATKALSVTSETAPKAPAEPQPGAVPSLTATEPPATPTPTKDDEDEEPQNSLTKKFTEAEWKALKELRVRFCPVISQSHY